MNSLFMELAGNKSSFFFLFLVLFSALVLFYLFYRDRAKNKNSKGIKKNGDRIELTLEKLNVIWKGPKKVEVRLKELARVWRTYDEAVGNQDIDELPHFRHDEILEFYVQYLRGKTWFRGKTKAVIFELLKILDEKGDCPSVVRAKDKGFDFDENAFILLSKVPLYRHSINVAKACFEFGVSGMFEPQAVIAALAHDLGKIPEYWGRLYTLGDHPVVSVVVLEKVIGFSELSFAEEVKQAVLNHHRAGKGKLVEILKKADRQARKKELSQALKEVEKKENSKIDKEKKEEPKIEGSEKAGVLELIADEEKEKKDVFDIECDFSWLDVNEFISILKEEINKVSMGKWVAFSMPDGVVYVHPSGLWGVLKKLALKYNVSDVLLSEGDKEFKRAVLVKFIDILRVEGLLCDDLIQKGYFAAPFYVYKEGEKKPSRVLYTPFKVEVFGLPSELEEKKEGTILKKIEKVEPAYEEVE